MNDNQDVVYSRLLRKFETDILDFVETESTNGRLNDIGRVRVQLRTELIKIITNNLDFSNKMKLLLHLGRELTKLDLPLAEICFEEAVEESTINLQEKNATVLKIESKLGLIICKNKTILQNSKYHLNPMSVSKLLQCLSDLRECLELLLDIPVSDRESLAWLMLNCCKLIYSISNPLILLGCGKYIIETILYASMCMDTVINLGTVRHLNFRMKMISTAVTASIIHGTHVESSNIIAYITKKVKDLRIFEELDPPLSDSISTTLQKAETDILIMNVVIHFWKDNNSILKIKELMPSAHIQLFEKSVNHVASSSLPTGEVSHATKTIHSSDDEGVMLSFTDRCLLECCRLQQLTCGNTNEPWKKRSSTLLKAFMMYTDRGASEVPSAATTSPRTQAAAAVAVANPTPTVNAIICIKPSLQVLVDICTIAMFDVIEDGVEVPKVIQRVMELSTEIIPHQPLDAHMIPSPTDNNDNNNDHDDHGHMGHMLSDNNKNNMNEKQSEKEFHILRLLTDYITRFSNGLHDKFAHIKLIDELDALIQDDVIYLRRKTLIRRIALAIWSKVIYPQLQKLLSDIEMDLNTPTPLSDVALTLIQMLRVSIRVLLISCHDDPVLLGSVSLATAHLMNLAGDSREALALLGKCIEVIDEYRASRVDIELHCPDDIRDVKALQMASFTAKNDDAAQWFHSIKRLGAHAFAGYGIFGTSSSASTYDAAVADIHTDLIVVLMRTEIMYSVSTRNSRLSLKNNFNKANAKEAVAEIANKGNNQKSVTSVVQQFAIKNVDKLSAVQSLKSTHGKHCYGRCLLYIEMARLEENNEITRKLLLDACSAAEEADKKESELIASFDNVGVVTESTSRYPTILSRSHKFFYVAPVGIRKKHWNTAQYFRILGKEEGSGTEVSPSSDELGGCDKKVYIEDMVSPIRSCVKISVLRSGEKYMFASGAYTSNGSVIGNLSPSSISVEAVNPLPTLLMWSFICELAYEKNEVNVAKRCASIVCDQFIKTSVPKQTPKPFGKGFNMFITDEFFLNMLTIQQTSTMQLKQFIKCFIIYESFNERAYAEDPLINTTDVEAQLVQVHWNYRQSQQMAVVTSMQKLALVMRIAATLQDHEIITRLACLAYSISSQYLCTDAIHLAQYLLNPVIVLLTAMQVIPWKNWRPLDHKLYTRFLNYVIKMSLITSNTKPIASVLQYLVDNSLNVGEDILNQYNGVFNNLSLRNKFLLNNDIESQIASFVHIPKSVEDIQNFNIWKSSYALVNYACNRYATGLIDPTTMNGDAVFTTFQTQLTNNSPITYSQYISILVCCVEELIRQMKFDGVNNLLQKFTLQKDMLGLNVFELASLWNILFLRQKIIPVVANSAEVINPTKNATPTGGAAAIAPLAEEIKSEEKAEDYVNPFRNVSVVEEISQYRGIASLCCNVALSKFGYKQTRNHFVNNDEGPYLSIAYDAFDNTVSSMAEKIRITIDAKNDVGNDANKVDIPQNNVTVSPRQAAVAAAATSTAPVVNDIPFTQIDYVRHMCYGIVLYVKGKCYQSVVDTTIRLWNSIIDAWYQPLQYAEEYLSLSNELSMVCYSLLAALQEQCQSVDRALNETPLINPNQTIDKSTEESTFPSEFVYSRDLKYDLYILKDAIIFLLKVLCLQQKYVDVVDVGIQFLQLYIQYSPEYASYMSKGCLISMVFSQEKIIANCVNDVQASEQAVTDLQVAWDDVQAKKRKKKLRIARAEKSEEEINFDNNKMLLEDKLQVSKNNLNENCDRKEMILNLEKRIDGIFTTGQQLLEKVRLNVKLFLIDCRGQLNALNGNADVQHSNENIHNRNQNTASASFISLLSTKSNYYQFEEINGYYNQVTNVLREKKEKNTLLQALNEQGDYLLLFGRRELAGNVWRDAIDGIFNSLDAWKNWHSIIGEIYKTPLSSVITKSAIPTMVVLGKLSRQCADNDNDMKSSYCQLAAKLARIPFMDSIGHPVELYGFAAYNCTQLGGHGALEFNLDTFSSFSFQSSLEEIIHVLGKESLQLAALPVIVILEHFHGIYSCQCDEWLRIRLIRIKYLIELHYFAEAISMMNSIIPSIRTIQRGVFSNPSLWPNDTECVASDTSSNGFDFHSKPHFCNHLPPESDVNQTALTWILNYSEYFVSCTKKDVILLPQKEKTPEELAQEALALQQAKEEALKAAKGKKGAAVAPPPESIISPVPSKQLFSQLLIADLTYTCCSYLLEIASLERKTSVSHRKLLETTSTHAETLLAKCVGMILPSQEKSENNEVPVHSSFNNPDWVSLYGRCRIMHVRLLVYKRKYKTARGNILSVLDTLQTIDHRKITNLQSKMELSNIWFSLKSYLCMICEYQARYHDLLIVATQSATEASMVCSGFWIRKFILYKAIGNNKLGQLDDCEVNCQSVISNYVASHIQDSNLVRCFTLLSSNLHAKSLNLSHEKCVQFLSNCLKYLRLANKYAISICQEYGFMGGDCNFTFSYTKSNVMKHDRFTPAHLNLTHIHVNYPDLVTNYQQSDTDRSKKQAVHHSSSYKNANFNGKPHNDHLRLGPVDEKVEYSQSEYSNIYLDITRVLLISLNALCIILDEIRSSDIEQELLQQVREEETKEEEGGGTASSGLDSENEVTVSLLEEQINAGEDGLKILRHVVYPPPNVKIGLLLSVGKTRTASCKNSSSTAGSISDTVFLQPFTAGLNVAKNGPHPWSTMIAYCLEVVECYGNVNLTIDCHPAERLKMAVKYLMTAVKLDNNKYDLEFNINKVLEDSTISSSSFCDEELDSYLQSISSSSSYGNTVTPLPQQEDIVLPAKAPVLGKDGKPVLEKSKSSVESKKPSSTPASAIVEKKPTSRDAIYLISTMMRECDPFWCDGNAYDVLHDVIAMTKKSFVQFGNKYFTKILPVIGEELVVVEATLTSLWSLSSNADSTLSSSSKNGLYDMLTGYVVLGGLKPTTIAGASIYATLEPFLTKIVINRSEFERLSVDMLKTKERLLYEADVNKSGIGEDFCNQLKRLVDLLRGKTEEKSWKFSLKSVVNESDKMKVSIALYLGEDELCLIAVNAANLLVFCSFISRMKACNSLQCDPAVSLLLWTIFRR